MYVAPTGEDVFITVARQFVGVSNSGNHLYLVSICDVTRQKHLENELELEKKITEQRDEEVNLFRTFFKSSPILMGNL